jgi:proteasome accessory factor C
VPEIGRRRAPNVAERLGRMLVVVPYLVQHPGTTLDEAASLFGVEPRLLRRDLELLFMSGLPPYGPGDLIDVDIDEDARIWIGMAEHFARPIRLTRQEALAVYLRATELLATPGIPEAPALAGALDKLRASLGPETLGDAGGIQATGGGVGPTHLDDMRDAVANEVRVRIGYRAASTGEHSERTIEPEAVFATLGRWYVVAWDVDADEERLFRVDRMTSAETIGERFEPRGLKGAGRPLYTPGEGDVPVRLLLRPEARWVAEYYVTTDVVERPDGSIEATLPAKRLSWIARLLLRLGPAAEVLAPATLRDEVRELAARSLTRYTG